MENPIINCNDDERNLRSKNIQIRLLGHCIVCLRKVSTKRLGGREQFGESASPEIAPKSVISMPGFLATFSQIWIVLQNKWKEKNNSKKDGKGLSEEIGISVENVLQSGSKSKYVSFSMAPTICQVCCDKVVAVENLMKAVRQQVREISILLEERRRRQDGGMGNFEKNLRENGLEESVIRATLQFVGIFEKIKSHGDAQVSTGDHASLELPVDEDMPCLISAVESVEENELVSSQVDNDEGNEGQTISDIEDNDDKDPDYLKQEPEEGDNRESTDDDEDESEEEMEVDEEDINDPDFKLGKDPLALFPEKRKERTSQKRKWRNQHGSGEKEDTNKDESSKFPCSCGKSFGTFKSLRDHMRKNLGDHPDYKPFSFTKPIDYKSEDRVRCSCGTTFESARNHQKHMSRFKELHPELEVCGGLHYGNRQICDLCGEWVMYNDILEHLTGVHLNGQEEWVIRCPNEKCRYLSVSSKEFNAHLNLATNKKCKMIWKEKSGPVCQICGFKGGNMYKIWNHVKDKHENGEEKKWKCPISDCEKRFFIKQSVQYHLYEHRYRPKKKQNCDKCGEDLKVEEMDGHLKDKHGVDEVIGCKQCEMKFSGKDEMIEHLYEHRGVGILCDICGDKQEKFVSRYSDFREHYWAVHQLYPKKYKCGECDNWYWRNVDKDEHEKRIHKDSNASIRYREFLVRGKVKDFKCEECNVNFAREDGLMNHNIKLHGAEPYKCDICGETFDMKAVFTRHKREHAGIFQKEWKCEVEGCGKIFQKKMNWKGHVEGVHGGVKSHVCEDCGKGFPLQQRLKKHRDAVHLGLRPWVCDECGESFTTNTTLRKHKLIHTGERPFVCDICGQRFRHNGVLRRHVQGHEKKGADFKPNGPMKKIRKRKAQ